MQAEPDSQAHLNNKGDVDGINFRPSSNFKHMKKYRKGNAASAGGESSGTRSEEEESRQGPESGTVQPPLPREPPPPDSPPITLKEEIVDEEYRGVGEVRPPDAAEPERERIMCRQFARGACTRGSSCIYAHEIIISQLPGIYTFCKDFQNSICSFARCKFVHASVFEKEYFYRSGYLPPHALAHLKQNAAPAPPPPPPGGVLTAEGDPSVRRVEVFPNLPPGAVVHPGPSGAMTGGGAEVRPPPDALAAAAGMPPHKRDWRLDDRGRWRARPRGRLFLYPPPGF